jgi:diguanylate cyclase (GGDEF)-like protein
MNPSLIPDLTAMATLIAILLVLRRRHPGRSIDLWLLGLILILVECLARLFYTSNPKAFLHAPLHALALDSYVLAGIIFTANAGRESFSKLNRLTYLAVNTLPLLALLTLYGLGHENNVQFLYCIICGLLIGVVSSITLQRGWQLVAAHIVSWGPMIWMATHHAFRGTAYWALFCLYVMAALAFQKSLPRKSIGRLVILTGFSVWALCFLFHPIVNRFPVYQDINSQIWDLQKFLISIGMLIVMLEDQITSNEWLALHDQLTKLPNRRLFDDRLDQAMARSRRLGTPVALIMIDLNGFKNINDSYGHAAGDELLRGVANNLRGIVRSSDTLARIGGDEFVIVAGDLPAETSGANPLPRLIAQIETALRKPIFIAGSSVSISGSLGVAVAPIDAQTPEFLLQVADKRMYTIKKHDAREHFADLLETPRA